MLPDDYNYPWRLLPEADRAGVAGRMAITKQRGKKERFVLLPIPEAKVVMEASCPDCIKNIEDARRTGSEVVWYDKPMGHVVTEADVRSWES